MPYVQEIQERVQKAHFDSHYEGSVAKDLELVQQVDGAKRDVKEWQSKAERLQRDNDSIKKELDKATKKIIQQIQQPKVGAQQVRQEPKVEVRSEDFSHWMA